MQLIHYSFLASLIPVALGRNDSHQLHRSPPETLGSMLLATSGKYVTDLSECPPLKPRTTLPTSVHDLRPDDFSVAMAIGDSITAGAFAKGIDPNDEYLNWVEWRGVSYAGGGDEGAVTMPNILKHHNSTLIGGGQGYNPGYEICFGSGCPVGPVGWNSTVDYLNAGQSGAYASNLLHEAQDYLVPQVKALNISDDRFKYLSFQVGANDVCQLCAAVDTPMGPSTKSDFEKNVRAALEYVRLNIRELLPVAVNREFLLKYAPLPANTLVNLFGAWKLTDIYALTSSKGQNYCHQQIPFVPRFAIGCPCIASADEEVGNFTRNQMDRLEAAVDTVLKKIVADYKSKNYNNFTVIWQPPNLPFKQYPIEAVSSVDCFHPSMAFHERLAAGLWNRLTLGSSGRAAPFTWDETPKYRCLEETDRIQT
ncbi:hypothetical protein FRC08_000053 [Ceratobasidium sp. 394]|nr:hypothetical protein FRC08_000053 [Ceratobasidium sp. 394]